MLKRLMGEIGSDQPMDQLRSRLLSLLFLGIAGAMSFVTYTHDGILWDSDVQIKPRFQSTLVALALVVPLYVRNVLQWNRSVYSSCLFVLVLMFFASLVEIALGGNSASNFVMPLLVTSIAMSWLGLREVAGASWIILLVIGAINGFFVNSALGLAGFGYLVFGVLGLSLNSGLSPGHIVSGVVREYRSERRGLVGRVVDDVSSIAKR